MTCTYYIHVAHTCCCLYSTYSHTAAGSVLLQQSPLVQRIQYYNNNAFIEKKKNISTRNISIARAADLWRINHHAAATGHSARRPRVLLFCLISCQDTQPLPPNRVGTVSLQFAVRIIYAYIYI